MKPLIDEGFELWLISNRGTRYSHTHEKYTDKDKEFWEFTWKDMTENDLPKHVEYIKNRTGVTKLGAYIGHS